MKKIKKNLRKYPDTMPVLESSDIIRNEYGEGRRHCLSGWVLECVGWDSPLAASLEKRLFAEAERMGLRSCGVSMNYYHRFPSVVQINDDRENRPRELAACWNRTIARLGYVVGNPEAKNVKRKAKAAR